METLRANVTIPEDVADLFGWFVKYDGRFEGSPAKVAAYMVRAGLQKEYAEVLKNITPLEPEIQDALAVMSDEALAAAVADGENTAARSPGQATAPRTQVPNRVRRSRAVGRR